MQSLFSAALGLQRVPQSCPWPAAFAADLLCS